ncbi:MAG TPA: SDR family oxidoreductase [Aldersonia sp.]
MTIAVTGVSGHLGRFVVERLLERGVPAGDIVAVVRTPEKIADLAARGVVVRAADFGDRAAVTAALAGVDRLLLVSGSEIGQRIPQHTNVIEAAKAAGVGFVAYTSAPYAATSPLALAADHKATEEVLTASGIPHAVLRNGWYWENYTNDLAGTIARGTLYGAAGTGKVAGAARTDYAEAAAVVLTSDGHDGKVYELGGDERLTYADLAAKISEVAGSTVTYENLPQAKYAQLLVGAGVPEQFAEILADNDAGIAVGALDIDSGDLQKLIGRASTPVADVLRAALA